MLQRPPRVAAIHDLSGFGRCSLTVILPVLSAMQAAAGMSLEKTKEVFLTIALFAHGYASILANHAMAYDGELIKKHLRQAYRGAVWAAQEKTT